MKQWRSTALEGFQQTAGDAGPAPTFDGGPASGRAQRGPHLCGKSEQLGELGGEVVRVAVVEAREMPVLLWVVLLEAGRNLGEAGVTGDERRRARGGSFGGDHPECLGEDGGHDRDIRKRQQMHEMPVLERAREQRALRSQALELFAVVAEADEHGARTERAKGVEQDVDAFVVEQLPEVEDRWLMGCEEPREPFGVAVVREALVRVAGIRWIRARLGDESGQRLLADFRPEFLDVDARRNLVHPRDVSHDVLQHLANVPGADEDRLGVLEARATPCSEVLVAAHRVLELGAVSLDREWKSGGDRDGPPEQDVIREHEIGRRVSAQSGRVQGDVTIALRAGAILQQLGLEAFVAVEDEDGQHTPDIRKVLALPTSYRSG